MRTSTIITLGTKETTAKEIVRLYAGSPTELTRQFKANGLRYCKVAKGGLTKYVVRGQNNNFRTVIKL